MQNKLFFKVIFCFGVVLGIAFLCGFGLRCSLGYEKSSVKIDECGYIIALLASDTNIPFSRKIEIFLKGKVGNIYVFHSSFRVTEHSCITKVLVNAVTHIPEGGNQCFIFFDSRDDSFFSIEDVLLDRSMDIVIFYLDEFGVDRKKTINLQCKKDCRFYSGFFDAFLSVLENNILGILRT